MQSSSLQPCPGYRANNFQQLVAAYEMKRPALQELQTTYFEVSCSGKGSRLSLIVPFIGVANRMRRRRDRNVHDSAPFALALDTSGILA